MVDLDSNPTKLLEVVETGKAAADDARLAHHLLDRQRRGEVLRHHPGDLRRRPTRSSGALNVMRLASPSSAILSAVIFNALVIVFLIPLALKGVRYRAGRRGRAAAPQPRDLRPRRPGRSLHRHQADRLAAGRGRTWSESIAMAPILRPALVLFALLGALTGVLYPLAVTGVAQAVFPAQAAGSLVLRDGAAGRLDADRPELQRPGPLLGPPVGHGADALQRGRLGRLQPGAAESGAGRRGQGAHRRAARGRSGQHRAGAGRPGHRLGQRARSAHQPGRRALPGGARGAVRAACRSTPSSG